jgi:hypothetical protein
MNALSADAEEGQIGPIHVKWPEKALSWVRTDFLIEVKSLRSAQNVFRVRERHSGNEIG